jgi:hypothetical protein
MSFWFATAPLLPLFSRRQRCKWAIRTRRRSSRNRGPRHVQPRWEAHVARRLGQATCAVRSDLAHHLEGQWRVAKWIWKDERPRRCTIRRRIDRLKHCRLVPISLHAPLASSSAYERTDRELAAGRSILDVAIWKAEDADGRIRHGGKAPKLGVASRFGTRRPWRPFGGVVYRLDMDAHDPVLRDLRRHSPKGPATSQRLADLGSWGGPNTVFEVAIRKVDYECSSRHEPEVSVQGTTKPASPERVAASDHREKGPARGTLRVNVH